MATDKLSVLTYLHKAVYERLAQFKQEHGIRSLSQAVEIVLIDYFGVAVPGIALPVELLSRRSHSDRGETSLEEKVAVLAEKYEYLCEALTLIQKDTNLPPDVTCTCHVDKSKEIKNLWGSHGFRENYQVSTVSRLTGEKLPISLSLEQVLARINRSGVSFKIKLQLFAN